MSDIAPDYAGHMPLWPLTTVLTQYTPATAEDCNKTEMES